MLKYQKKGLYKALSMLLVATMFLTAPIGTIQAYGLEDGQPVAKETGLEHNPATLSDASMIQSSAALYRLPDIFVIKTADDLREVLNNLVDGDVIRLSDNIDYITNDLAVGIYKKITFDLGNYTLNITSSQNDGTGLVVGSGGEVSLQGFTGELNVSGGRYGLQVLGGPEFAQAMVTNATARNAGGAGISAVGNANAIALGNISSYDAGAHASGIESTVLVHGKISARTFGTYSIAGGKITTKQGVTQIGEDGTGAYISGSEAGSIMIGGDIQAKDYIRFDDTFVAKGDGVADPTEPGYTKYTNGARVVWVKGVIVPDDSVCEIDGVQYATFDEALGAVQLGETKTIKLLKDINYDKGIIIDGKTVTFDVGIFTLSVTNTTSSHGIGLTVTNSAHVNLVGSGEFNVTHISNSGESIGLLVHGGSSATVTNVKAVAGVGSGVYANGNGAIIHVLGNVEATGSSAYGARTWNAGLITIDGMLLTASRYIDIGGEHKTKTEGVEDPTKTGYLKYSDSKTTGVVWVKDSTQAGEKSHDAKLYSLSYIINDGEPIPITTFQNWLQTYRIDLPVDTLVNARIKLTGVTNHPAATMNLNNSAITLVGGEGSSYIMVTAEDGVSNAGYYVNFFAPYKINVTGGTSDKEWSVKDNPVIVTASIPEGKAFDKWTATGITLTVEQQVKNPLTFYMPGKTDISLTAHYQELPKGYYTITVQNDGNGTASANVNSAAQGEEIALTASANDGYQLKEWQIISGGLSVVNNKFSMPGANVTIKAIFELIPATTYTVSVNGSYAGITGAGSYAQGVTITINAGTRSGYSFTGWTSSEGVIFANKSSATTTFTMPVKNVIVTAAWSYNGSGSSNSGGSGSSGDSSSTKATTIPEKEPGQPVMVVSHITATAGANGAASAAIPEKSVTDAIAKAQADAKTQGKNAKGIAVELDVTMPKEATSLTVTLTRNSLNSLVSAGVSSLTINGSLVTVSLDQRALVEIGKQSTDDVRISIKPANNLSDVAKKLIGERPVYDISVSYVKGGKTIVVSALNGGIAAITIPYTLGKNEASSYLCGVYLDVKGKVTRMEGSAYDANEGAVLISTGYLSVFGVGYTAPSTKFTDINNHWGKESIGYMVDRGLLSGTSETIFAPNTAMTREMLVTALGRLAGVDTKSYTESSFTDVKADSTFCPYIEWAYKKGIVHGIGNQQFAPDRVITREEIAVIFANYAKATGYKLPVTREATAYVDASSIGSAYKVAVTAMQQASIMMGDSGNKFKPKSNATRAEISAMLHRYIKLTID